MTHSVVLDYRRCRGCTTCIKTCPTEAIRVRRGKAEILPTRCIDCGRCIQVCPHKAIKSVGDRMERLHEFAYCVAVPDPALYGQFEHMGDIDIILNGLLKIGFDRVYEAAKGAELLSDYSRQCIAGNVERTLPQISSNCPTVMRLIRMRFPRLIDHIEPIITPIELSAILARREAVAETGLAPEQIGVFSIVPCSSKVTASHDPEGLDHPVLDGAFAIRDIYLRLLTPMKELEELRPLSSAGIMGLGWSGCGGESNARLDQRYVAVDGIDNVIRMLEEIEDGRIPEADFIELCACTQGCVGGCFTVENPYAARMKIQKLMEGLPVSRSRFLFKGEDRDVVKFNRQLQYSPAFLLDEDREQAMAKHLRIEALEAKLPGLHCGSCGAPNCHAFAEDVVLGFASPEDCIFKMRERVRSMTGDTDNYLPPPFRQQRPKPPEEQEPSIPSER